MNKVEKIAIGLYIVYFGLWCSRFWKFVSFSEFANGIIAGSLFTFFIVVGCLSVGIGMFLSGLFDKKRWR